MEWIEINDSNLPTHDNEVLLYNKEWERPWNPSGIRIGFLQMSFKLFLTAEWIEETDGYCNDADQPTHWLPLPNSPKNK